MASLNDAQREELVVMQILTQSIVQLNGLIVANAQRTSSGAFASSSTTGGKGSKGGGGALVTQSGMMGVIQTMLKSFSGIAVLGSIMSGMQPAFQIFSAALNILGTTILPLVMPVFAILAGGLLMVSDTLWRVIEPSLGDFYGVIFNTAIPALNSFAVALEAAVAAINGTVDQMSRRGNDMSKFEKIGEENYQAVKKQALAEGKSAEEAERLARLSKFGGAVSEQDYADIDRLREAGLSKETKEQRKKNAAAIGPAGREESQGGLNAMRTVFAELRSQQASKAKFTSIEDVSRNATLAGQNRSPFEAQIFERMDKMLSAMERAADNTEKKDLPTYGQYRAAH